ncbi:thiamine-phosphate kinase [Singulisphaera sp. PoT]|uniref:thiamine-phosphate kinase n=1 Tax=Singulisphaera sp. PoT TaxID=3411797 RepID=UPI003BF5B28F
MSPESKPLDEFGLIGWIRSRTKSRSQTIRGIGDDCAQLRPSPGSDLLITTDMLMDGRHFELAVAGPRAVGYKALGVNLSDIAAMAGIPTAAVIAVSLPRRDAISVAQGLHDGLSELAERFGVDLVGGDTNAWDGPLVISITLLGQTTERGPVLRTGAKPGDLIYVTGPLGGSLAGRHLRPEPRVAEALALHEAVGLHALVDISDGVAADLGHILEESGNLGAILDAGRIPIHTDVEFESLRDGRSPLEHALHDGEDFELCFTIAPEDASRLEALRLPSIVLHQIGLVTAEPSLRLRTEGDQVVPLEARGFNHLHPSP